MRLYLLRHEKRDIHNSRFESPLLVEGLEDAHKLKYKLNDLNINCIYVSPFKRVLQTIKPYCDMNNIAVNCEFGLCEIFNEEDLKLYNITNFFDINSIKSEYNILNHSYKSIVKIEDINIQNDSCDRIDKFMNNIINKYIKTNHNILIVTHMSVINHILKRDLDIFYPMGSLCEITNMNTGEYKLL